jgi:branched-chain amino acid aminotransferase
MDKPRYYFVGDTEKADLDFANLGFDYIQCPYRFEAVFEHGMWRVRGLLEDSVMQLPEGSQCLHYGQQLFEGMKVQTGADGKIYAFRPRDNAQRLNEGARYLKGPEIPEDLFVRGVEEVAAANYPYVPPHGVGSALYLRPLYIGIDDNVGVKPASRYLFRIFVTPVGPYFRGGFGPDQGRSFVVTSFDRAAPHGTGHIKAGGNYAASFHPGSEARAQGFDDVLFLDPAEHKYIDEIGAANFLGLKNGTLVTPDSIWRPPRAAEPRPSSPGSGESSTATECGSSSSTSDGSSSTTGLWAFRQPARTILSAGGTRYRSNPHYSPGVYCGPRMTATC